MTTYDTVADDFLGMRNVFIALGDETRQGIITALIRAGCAGLRVGEITKKTHLSRPAVSYHLKVLKNARIVQVNKQGTMNFYYINPQGALIDQLLDLFNNVRGLLATSEQQGEI